MTIFMDVDAALAEVPVNTVPMTDSGDFVTIETGVAYNASGMALTWHFVTTSGAYTPTAVTPTTGGDYDWAHQAQGMYTIAMTASGGASINNDTEGFGYFTGVCDGVLPWRGPTICFRAAGKNDLLVDGAHSATRGLAGTALPDAAADAAGGLPISDAGGLDMDSRLDAAITSRMASYTQPTGFLAATFPTTVASTTNITGGTITTVTNLTNAPTSGDFTATMKTSIGTAVAASAVASVTGNVGGNVAGSVGSVTGAVGSVTAGVTVTTNNDKTGYTASTVSDKTGYSLSATGSAAMTESYAAAGAAPTIVQILYEIRALMAEKGISSTTLTTKKLDGSTTAATYTLDDATTPSSITRAT